MDPDLLFFKNNAALDMINFLDQKEPEDCIKEMVENNNITALKIDHITDELTMIHHITRIGPSMKDSLRLRLTIKLRPIIF